MTSIAPFAARAAWNALDAYYTKIHELHLLKLFADDAIRGERMAVEAVSIYFDYSKHRITDETLIIPKLETETESQLQHDSSTNTLIRRYGSSRQL